MAKVKNLPPHMQRKYQSVLSFRLDSLQEEEVIAYAKQEKISLGEAIRSLLEFGLEAARDAR